MPARPNVRPLRFRHREANRVSNFARRDFVAANKKLRGTLGCVPATTTNGIPIGPPWNAPDPKSATSGLSAPMVATYVFEFGSTGRRSMGVFQTLLAGNTAQPLSVWPPASP